MQEVEVADGFRHIEVYTMHGLLTLLWHGPVDATEVLVTCGGGMGSLLGPADGLYHDLGVGLAAHGIGTARAFQVNADAGAFASLAFALHGLIAAVLFPTVYLLLA